MLSFLKHPYSKIILGIIWGFGLSCILAKSCNNRNCIIYKSPNPNDVVDKIWGEDNKCYQYAIQNTQCSLNAIETYKNKKIQKKIQEEKKELKNNGIQK